MVPGLPCVVPGPGTATPCTSSHRYSVQVPKPQETRTVSRAIAVVGATAASTASPSEIVLKRAMMRPFRYATRSGSHENKSRITGNVNRTGRERSVVFVLRTDSSRHGPYISRCAIEIAILLLNFSNIIIYLDIRSLRRIARTIGIPRYDFVRPALSRGAQKSAWSRRRPAALFALAPSNARAHIPR